MKSLDCLRPRGMLVSFGNASGAVTEFAPLILSQKGSLFLTRPTLANYTATVEELDWRASDVLNWIGQGKLKLHIHKVYPLCGSRPGASRSGRPEDDRKAAAACRLIAPPFRSASLKIESGNGRVAGFRAAQRSLPQRLHRRQWLAAGDARIRKRCSPIRASPFRPRKNVPARSRPSPRRRSIKPRSRPFAGSASSGLDLKPRACCTKCISASRSRCRAG